MYIDPLDWVFVTRRDEALPAVTIVMTPEYVATLLWHRVQAATMMGLMSCV